MPQRLADRWLVRETIFQDHVVRQAAVAVFNQKLQFPAADDFER